MPQTFTTPKVQNEAPARAPLLLFLVCTLLLGVLFVAGFAIGYELLRDHPGHAPRLIGAVYAVLTAGLVVLAAQSAVVIALLARPLRAALLRAEGLARALDQHSHRDPLTAVFNRTAFEQLAERELESLKRYGAIFSLILLDVDGFRAVNERLGYPAGDAALADVAALLRTHMRKADVLFRWRSGRFMVLASGIGQEKAESFAAKLRDLVAGHAFREELRLNICAGVAQARGEDGQGTLVGRVKAALALAKSRGEGSVAGAPLAVE
jgi:diguanylate cyclase (GGDEF)-like protein